MCTEDKELRDKLVEQHFDAYYKARLELQKAKFEVIFDSIEDIIISAKSPKRDTNEYSGGKYPTSDDDSINYKVVPGEFIKIDYTLPGAFGKRNIVNILVNFSSGNFTAWVGMYSDNFLKVEDYLDKIKFLHKKYYPELKEDY